MCWALWRLGETGQLYTHKLFIHGACSIFERERRQIRRVQANGESARTDLPAHDIGAGQSVLKVHTVCRVTDQERQGRVGVAGTSLYFTIYTTGSRLRGLEYRRMARGAVTSQTSWRSWNKRPCVPPFVPLPGFGSCLRCSIWMRRCWRSRTLGGFPCPG